MNQTQIENRIQDVRSAMTKEVETFGRKIKRGQPANKLQAINDHLTMMTDFEQQLTSLYNALDKTRNF